MLANVYDLNSLTHRNVDPVVLDCGANVGFFTRLALESGAAHVVAFEPSPKNQTCLRRNLQGEIAAGEVTVVEKGVWDSEATLSFSTRNTNNPGGHHVALDGTGDVDVPMTTIDVTCRQLNLTGSTSSKWTLKELRSEPSRVQDM